MELGDSSDGGAAPTASFFGTACTTSARQCSGSAEMMPWASEAVQDEPAVSVGADALYEEAAMEASTSGGSGKGPSGILSRESGLNGSGSVWDSCRIAGKLAVTEMGLGSV